jgi:hypothetical protein
MGLFASIGSLVSGAVGFAGGLVSGVFSSLGSFLSNRRLKSDIAAVDWSR